jgi:hypothetical protein
MRKEPGKPSQRLKGLPLLMTGRDTPPPHVNKLGTGQMSKEELIIGPPLEPPPVPKAVINRLRRFNGTRSAY